MKKFISILMTVAIAGILVAGCSSSDENATTDNAAPTTDNAAPTGG